MSSAVAAVLLTVALLAAGCGGRSAQDQAEHDFQVSALTLDMNLVFTDLLKSATQGDDAGTQTNLARLMDAAESHKKTIGNDAMFKILLHDALVIGPYCGYCADDIDRERDAL